MKNEKKKRKGLSFKIIIGYILLAVLITVQSLAVGVLTFKDKTIARYNEVAYQMSVETGNLIATEDLVKYSDLVQGYVAGTVTAETLQAEMDTPEYKEYIKKLDDFRIAMKANDIMVAWMDRNAFVNYNEDAIEADESRTDLMPMKFLFDSYYIEDQRFLLGDSWYVKQEYAEMMDRCAASGKDPTEDETIISDGTFGYTITSYHPLTVEGKVAAVVLIEIPMSKLESDITSFVTVLTVLAILLTAVILVICIIVIYRTIIVPITKISKEADDFVSNNNLVTGELEKIKTRDELQTLAESINKMQIEINDYIKDITAITAEKERIGAELNVATHIQASMLPSIFPAFPDREEFDIYATMNPAKEVGGDFYDFFLVDEKHIAIVMADVSGKGVPAALFMVIAKTLIKDHTVPETDLGEIFSTVNNLLCESNSGQMFVTAFEGVLDLETGEFRFVNAGHEMPFICKQGGKYEPYKIRPGFVLAGMDDMMYKGGVIQLDVGDKIYQYTDGVTEATNADNRLYGMERLENILCKNADKKPTELLPLVKADIDAFVGEAPQFDDITMLCLEYKKKYEKKGE